MTGAITLHRVLRARPDKVYRAFLDADAVARWLPPNGFTCRVEHLDATVGGTFRMAFRNFSTGNGHAFGGTYLELEPGARIAYTDRFDDPGLPGELVTTVTLREVLCGTHLTVEQTGIPAVIPVELCQLGWQESLDHLARLVEPEIAD
ncbi:MAG TPA: SRPBCC family protein [Myxococcota bacterium]|nr:SRPBCC family protein [Myxococcota bacterium]